MMIAVLSLLAALAPAARLPGVVHDSTGGVVSGAAVVVRAATGAEQRAVTGPDGRFTVECPASGDITHRRPRRRASPKNQQTHAGERAATSTSCSTPAALLEDGHRHADAHRAAPRRRAGERQRAHQRGDPAVAGVVADDVLRQVPTFSLFRRTSSLVVASDGAGRVAARHRAERRRAARSCCSTACRSTIRSAAGSTGRACRSRASIASRWSTDSTLEPVRQLRDGRRHQHRHQPADAADGRAQAAVRQPRQPEVRLLRQRRRGARSASRSKAASSTPTASRSSRASERGPIDNNADVEFSNVNVKLDYSPTDRVNAFFRAGYFSENRDNGKVGELNDTQVERSAERRRARRGCRTTATCRRRVFVDVETFHSNFLAVTHRGHVARATSSAWRPISTCRPTASAAWCSGRKALGATNCFSAGADWRWVDGDSQEDAYNAAPGADRAADARTRCCRCSASPAARSRASARSCRTSSRRCRSSSITLSARVDHWRNYDAPQPRDHRRRPGRRPRATTGRRIAATATTPSSARAPRRCYHVTRSSQRRGATSAPASARRRSTSCTGSSASARC